MDDIRANCLVNYPFAQPFVTEIDLKNALLPQAAIDYLREVMPAYDGEAKEFDYEQWLDYVFPDSH